VVPEPTDWDDVLVEEARFGSVPYSNHAFVAKPFAVTLPFRVAPVALTEVADNEATVGGLPGEEVVKLITRPLECPLLFSAQNRK
jgi:hypothetical protein